MFVYTTNSQIVVSELMFGRPTESFRLLPDFTLELGLGHRTMRLPIKRSATTRSELPPQATSARPGMAATIVTVTGAVPTSGATVGTCGKTGTATISTSLAASRLAETAVQQREEGRAVRSALYCSCEFRLMRLQISSTVAVHTPPSNWQVTRTFLGDDRLLESGTALALGAP